MAMQKAFDFTLTGRMPLLMHADDVEQSDELAAWRKNPDNRKASVAGDDRSPAWTWQTYTYSDGKHVAWPAANLMCAIRSAGAQMILKKQKTFKELSQSGLLVQSEFIDLFVNGKQIAIADMESVRDKTFAEQCEWASSRGFRLWAKRARVGQAKHVRVRPRFETWTMKGSILVMSADITEDILRQLFALAGNVGMGDWRPGCRTPGAFGQFDVKLG